MIRLKFKSKDKELEFFKSIEKYNYLNDACINFAMMVNEDQKEEDIFDIKLNDRYKDL